MGRTWSREVRGTLSAGPAYEDRDKLTLGRDMAFVSEIATGSSGSWSLHKGLQVHGGCVCRCMVGGCAGAWWVCVHLCGVLPSFPSKLVSGRRCFLRFLRTEVMRVGT